MPTNNNVTPTPQTTPTTTDYTKQIEARRAALKRMETARIKAEADKANAEKRLAELEEEVRALGYDPTPEKLSEAIAKLDAEIVEGLESVARMIPPEFRG